MDKRRVTLNLDQDVVEALESVQGISVSAAANDAFRGSMPSTERPPQPRSRRAEALVEQLELPSPHIEYLVAGPGRDGSKWPSRGTAVHGTRIIARRAELAR